MKKMFASAIAVLLFAGASVHAAAELLKTQDVSKIMGQIFSQHVDKHEMTPELLKKSFRVYIDQFDPERIYLLQSEVSPFAEMSGSALLRVFQEYSRGDFSAFHSLDGVIQSAIARAREMRGVIEQDNGKLFEDSRENSNEFDDFSDPDLKKAFAKALPELKERMTYHLLQFIAAEKQRFGSKKVLDYQKQTLEIYNKHMEKYENKYLYLDDAGKPLSVALKENLFTFHVLKALAGSLDAHTTVLNPAEAYDMRVRLEKGFQGVGIGLKQAEDGALIVTSLVEGGPAEQSGQIRVGDRLIEVNGISVAKKPIRQVMEQIRGTEGSPVKFVFQRSESFGGGTKTINVDLIKKSISLNSDRVETSYEPYGNGIIGKITLHSFYQGANGVSSENDVQRAIEELSKKGPIKGLILDLRENSGGFLSQAVKVAGLFITNGVIVISKYSNGEEHVYRDMNSKDIYDGPLIILTSKATASAAEIVAQALQDYGVALIVGDEHTYGKGTIQSQTVTDNASTSYFKVTVGKYYTVSGKTPQIAGVKADIVVPSPFIDEHIGEEYLEYPLSSDLIPSTYNDQLVDVDPNLKSWYLHYYTPTLQQRETKWRDMLPVLQKKEKERLAKNILYQQFVATEHSATGEANKIRKRYWREDVQMQEAVGILKDMAAMEGREGESHSTADGAVGYPPESRDGKSSW